MASTRRSASKPFAAPVADHASLPDRLRARLLSDDGAVSWSAVPATTNPEDRPLLAVAFSGGLDSTVLLDLVSRLWPPDRLLALHVHHHLQPAADAWPAHCQTFAAARGVRCRVLHARSRPAPGESIEQWARNERYRVLVAEARAQGAGALLTAHHADDQAETVLLRMRRGSGPRGLSGILPVRYVEGLPVLRPLLDSRRADLIEYARRSRLQWVEDPSNDDLRFPRNRLRRQGREAPLSDVEVTRLRTQAECARLDWQRIERVAVADLEAAIRAGSLDRGVLQALPRERCVWALREWVGRFGLPPPSRPQTDQLMRQLIDGAAGNAEVVVGDVALLRHRDRLFGLRGAAAARRRRAAAAALEPIPLRDLPAVQQEAGLRTIELPARLGRLLVHADRADASPDLRVAGGGQGGWRLRAHVGRPSRTLKNLYQEAGIPAWLRPLYPVVSMGGDVVFSAALGHGVPAAGRTCAPWSSPVLDWEPSDEDDLAALLCWCAPPGAAPVAAV